MTFPDRIIGIKRRWILTAGLLIGAGVGIGLAAPADRGKRQGTAPQHFKSGSERSLVILAEIRDTLKEIDTRLQRIEKVVLAAAVKEPDLQRARPQDAKELGR